MPRISCGYPQEDLWAMRETIKKSLWISQNPLVKKEIWVEKSNTGRLNIYLEKKVASRSWMQVNEDKPRTATKPL